MSCRVQLSGAWALKRWLEMLPDLPALADANIQTILWLAVNIRFPLHSQLPVSTNGKQMASHIKQLVAVQNDHISAGLVFLGRESCHNSGKSLHDLESATSQTPLEAVLLTAPSCYASSGEPATHMNLDHALPAAKCPYRTDLSVHDSLCRPYTVCHPAIYPERGKNLHRTSIMPLPKSQSTNDISAGQRSFPHILCLKLVDAPFKLFPCCLQLNNCNLYGLVPGQQHASWPEHEMTTVQATQLLRTQQDTWRSEALCMAWLIATSVHPCLRLPIV